MGRFVRRFIASEDGAVTVDFVGIMAASILLALGVGGAVSSGAIEFSNTISATLEGDGGMSPFVNGRPSGGTYGNGGSGGDDDGDEDDDDDDDGGDDDGKGGGDDDHDGDDDGGKGGGDDDHDGDDDGGKGGGNPGNDKDVGNAGETPNGKGGWGDGTKGQSQ